MSWKITAFAPRPVIEGALLAHEDGFAQKIARMQHPVRGDQSGIFARDQDKRFPVQKRLLQVWVAGR